MTIKPEELTQEERAIWDQMAVSDWAFRNEQGADPANSYLGCEAAFEEIIGYRRALFAAPAPPQEAAPVEGATCQNTTGVCHELKVWPEQFEAIILGDKKFEYRKDDRGFAVGDTLLLRRWCPKTGRYIETERCNSIHATISYIADSPAFGIPDGFCVLSIVLSDIKDNSHGIPAPAPGKVETGRELPLAVQVALEALRHQRKSGAADGLERWAHSLPAAPPEPKLEVPVEAIRKVLSAAEERAEFLNDRGDDTDARMARRIEMDRVAVQLWLDALEAK